MIIECGTWRCPLPPSAKVHELDSKGLSRTRNMEVTDNVEILTDAPSIEHATDLIPRTSVETIVRLRDVALEKYDVAYKALRAAQDSIMDAKSRVQRCLSRSPEQLQLWVVYLFENCL